MDSFVSVWIRPLGLVAVELDVAPIELVDGADGAKHLAPEAHEIRSLGIKRILPWLCWGSRRLRQKIDGALDRSSVGACVGPAAAESRLGCWAHLGFYVRTALCWWPWPCRSGRLQLGLEDPLAMMLRLVLAFCLGQDNQAWSFSVVV